MPDQKLTPPPRTGDAKLDDWLFKLREKVEGIEVTEASTDGLSATQRTDLTDSGSSTLHYHAADRARANHTGTQTADTISDLASFVDARVTSSSSSSGGSTDILAAQIFGG